MAGSACRAWPLQTQRWQLVEPFPRRVIPREDDNDADRGLVTLAAVGLSGKVLVVMERIV